MFRVYKTNTIREQQNYDYLLTELTLIGALTVVQLGRVFHDVLLAQNGRTANLAVVLSYRQTVSDVVKDRTVSTIVQRMREGHVAAAASW